MIQKLSEDPLGARCGRHKWKLPKTASHTLTVHRCRESDERGRGSPLKASNCVRLGGSVIREREKKMKRWRKVWSSYNLKRSTPNIFKYFRFWSLISKDEFEQTKIRFRYYLPEESNVANQRGALFCRFTLHSKFPLSSSKKNFTYACGLRTNVTSLKNYCLLWFRNLF